MSANSVLMLSKKRYVILLLLLAAMIPMAHAQFYNGMNMPFGKNRVQYGDFHWSYYMNDNFDVYYYQGGGDLARYSQAYAKDQIPRLEARLNSRFGKKIQFLVFNSKGDFKQSNINLDEEENGNTGGITKIIGTKVILYFDGDYTHFEAQIREGIARLLFNQVMNGISIGSQIRNSYRYDIPIWFQDGLVAYIAGNWDSYKESQLQRGIVSGNYRKINHLRDEDALIAGYSFWNFIDEKYGSKSFNDILTLAESTSNIRKALLYVTGKEYKELVEEWYEFYKLSYETLLVNLPNDLMKLKYKKYPLSAQMESILHTSATTKARSVYGLKTCKPANDNCFSRLAITPMRISTPRFHSWPGIPTAKSCRLSLRKKAKYNSTTWTSTRARKPTPTSSTSKRSARSPTLTRAVRLCSLPPAWASLTFMSTTCFPTRWNK